MCGRFVSARKRLELLEEFAVERDLVPADRDPDHADYNVAPTKRIYAVLDRVEEGKPQRELRLVRWGLVPSWAKDASVGARMINARAETVAVKPAFRSAFAKRRCLIPADGYYEWQAAPEGTRAPKQPHYIYRTDGGVLAFAGIYELRRDGSLPSDSEQDVSASGGDPPGTPRESWLWTASIITTDATDEIGKIHDRTPMVITPEAWADWLDPFNSDKDLLMATMRPAPFSGTGGLTSHLVSTAVNSVRNNGPGLIARLGDGGPGSPGEADQPSLF
ncbi:MAG TPA: SOS response-associated peptidase [Trebonia sp.]|jgi:putative SOS response-associated peptidase YedK|nr:SOS response-associated peptidase [Trebonia sp.]